MCRSSCQHAQASQTVPSLPPHTGIPAVSLLPRPHYCCPWKLAVLQPPWLENGFIPHGAHFPTFLYLELKLFLFCIWLAEPSSRVCIPAPREGGKVSFLAFTLDRRDPSCEKFSPPHPGEGVQRAWGTWVVYLSGSAFSLLFCLCGPAPWNTARTAQWHHSWPGNLSK